MSQIKKLLAAARNNQKNFRYSKAIKIVKHAGRVWSSTKGSHEIYKHPALSVPPVNLQDKNGEIKPYQLKQILDLIDEHDLLSEE